MEHLPSWTSQALLQSLSGLDSRPKGEQAEEDYRSGTHLKFVKWGASSQWSPYLYCPMRYSDEMTLGKMHPTLWCVSQTGLVTWRYKWNIGDFKFWSVKIGDISAALACPLCQGYIIDAISLDSCGHAFCRGCILRHAQDSKLCPGKLNYCSNWPVITGL